MPHPNVPLFIGTNGFVAALDPRTGDEIWRSKLPRCGGMGEPLSLLITADYVYAGANGRVWCVDRRDGRVVWCNGLPKMGFHSVAMAMEGAATSGASPSFPDVRRRRAAAASAAT